MRINVTYTHTFCLVGKQHGPLAYTLTLLPGEKMTLFQSDRYRRTTSDTERYSVQTTFSQFLSALYQQQNSNDSSALVAGAEQPVPELQRLGRRRREHSSVLAWAAAGAANSRLAPVRRSICRPQRAPTVSSPLAQQASQYTDLQRSITISSYEDAETVSTTQRTLVNNNLCYAVNYFVRKVLDVYTSTTKVTAVTYQVTVGNYVSAVPDAGRDRPSRRRNTELP